MNPDPGFIFLKLVTNPGYRGKIPFSAGAPFTVSYTRLSMTRKNWNSIDWLRTFLLFWIIIFKWIRFNLATCQKYSWGWSNSVSLSSQSPQAHCKVIYNFFNNKLFSSKTEFIFFIKIQNQSFNQICFFSEGVPWLVRTLHFLHAILFSSHLNPNLNIPSWSFPLIQSFSKSLLNSLFVFLFVLENIKLLMVIAI